MESSNKVIIWWFLLIAITIVNLGLLYYARTLYRHKEKSMIPELKKFRNWQFYLAALYTLGCGFRSIFPRGDIRRIVMVDSWISAIALGRTAATIGELSFVLQISIFLYEIGRFTNNRLLQQLAKLPFPIIFLAELFSWYACTTTNYIGTVVEESLWAFTFTIILLAILIARPYYVKKQRQFLNLAAFFALGYVIYMVSVDIPAYYQNWLIVESTDKIYPSVWDGFLETLTEWNYTRVAVDWQYEFIWMTLYFSIAVWLSIALINAPFFDRNFSNR